MDSRIVLEAVLQESMQVSRTNWEGVPFSAYTDGFNAYCEGQPLEDMPSEEHQRGWWGANRGQAVAETDEWLAARLEELVDGQEDEEFNRWGGA